MGKKNEIKEYGADLEKDYIDLQKKLTTNRNKVVKRAKFLVKKNPEFMIGSEPVKEIIDGAFDCMDTSALLYIIKRIEEDYVSKTKQLGINFNDK